MQRPVCPSPILGSPVNVSWVWLGVRYFMFIIRLTGQVGFDWAMLHAYWAHRSMQVGFGWALFHVQDYNTLILGSQVTLGLVGRCVMFKITIL